MHIHSNNYEKTKELLDSAGIQYSDHVPQVEGPVACDFGLDVLREFLIEHGDTLILAIAGLLAGRKIKINFTTKDNEVRVLTDESTPETLKETIKKTKSLVIYWEE